MQAAQYINALKQMATNSGAARGQVITKEDIQAAQAERLQLNSLYHFHGAAGRAAPCRSCFACAAWHL